MAETNKNNFDKLQGFSEENLAAIRKIVADAMASQPTVQQQNNDALGNRAVTQQAQQQRLNQQAPVPTAPRRNQAFSRTDDDNAHNAMRLILGLSSPYYPATLRGINTYIPSFHRAYIILDSCDEQMSTTKQFYDGSAGWHPIISRYYIAVLLHIHVFSAMRSAGQLRYAAALFYDQFVNNHPLETLPIPGPLVPVFQSLASSIPSTEELDNVVPELPLACSASRATNCHLANAFLGRIPSPAALLDQYVRLITFASARNNANTQFTNSVQDVADWNGFLTVLCGNDLTAIPAATDSAITKRAITSTVLEETLSSHSPGLNQPVWCSPSIAEKLQSQGRRLKGIIPTAMTADTSTNSIGWDRYMTVDTTANAAFFDTVTTWMTNYSKFFRSSKPLSEISPAGHTAGQVTYLPTATLATPTTLYTAFNPAFEASVRNLACPDSDKLDAAVSLLNVDNYFDDNTAAIRTGPFFTNLPVYENSSHIHYTNGIGTIIKDKFHVTRPT
jgi:hypothetical protein